MNKMIVHLAGTKNGSYIVREHLYVDIDYVFMGLLIDLSYMKDKDSSIPEKPILNTEMLGNDAWVEMFLLDEKIIVHPDKDIFSCKAEEFRKIPKEISSTQKNIAILNFVKDLEPKTLILLEYARE